MTIGALDPSPANFVMSVQISTPLHSASTVSSECSEGDLRLEFVSLRSPRKSSLGAAAVMQKPTSRQELYEALADPGLLPLWTAPR